MKRITIIGGGLAGLSLGIALRGRDVPVTIMEAGRYPRHRVCGEFISGGGWRFLEENQMTKALPPDSVRIAHTAAFFSARQRIHAQPLPLAAHCVSRFVLDAALSARFQERGGALHENERKQKDVVSEGTVWATGRRAHPVEEGWRWFGLKIHARNVLLEADLEMHLAPNSYVGLCRLPDGEVNVCGLFRRRITDPSQGSSRDWLLGERSSPLWQRLERADFDEESFCAVAGLSLRAQPIDPDVCRIGDALTMIPPITGNGMSMAFESANLALEPLCDYSRGKSEWPAVTRQIASAQQEQFGGRLRWAGCFHRVLFSRAGVTILGPLLHSSRFWRAAFAATR